MAATTWRSLRARLADKGIADPMTQFPHLHALLDYAELVWLEALHTGKETEDRAARDQYFTLMYGPEPTPKHRRRGQDTRPQPAAVPAGFQDKQQIEQQFDAVAAALGGGSRRARSAR
jgi:hypothetical protein